VTQPVWSTACPDWEERIVEPAVADPVRSAVPGEAEGGARDLRDLRRSSMRAGRPTMGEACRQWVFDFVAAIFGAYDAETGRRLIQYFFLLISKKNSKSTLAAGIMVTALIRNWRESASSTSWRRPRRSPTTPSIPARDMVQADPDLRRSCKPAGRTIEHRNTGAFLKVVAADSETVGGKKTIGLLVDELWLFGKRAAPRTCCSRRWAAWRRGPKAS
jgi:phage terminase large subunit-like protein